MKLRRAITSQPNSTPPTITLGTGAGTSPTGLTIEGNGVCGTISFTTGTLPQVSDIFTLAMASPFTGKVILQLMPATTTSSTHTERVYVSSSNGNQIVVSARAALTASTAYSWHYHILGTASA